MSHGGRLRGVPLVAVLGALTAAAALAGCSTVQSSDLRTSGIESTVTVVATRDGIDVRDFLGAGGLSSVQLDASDTLTASVGGQSVDLDEASAFGTRDYEGHLDAAADPGVSVTVALARGSDDTSAPSSTVAMPDPVRVASPAAGATMHTRRDTTFAVNRAPGSFRITWQASCVVADEKTGVEVNEGAPVVLPAGSLVHVEGQPRSCSGTFGITRITSGTLDPAFKSGGITAERTAYVALHIVVGR